MNMAESSPKSVSLNKKQKVRMTRKNGQFNEIDLSVKFWIPGFIEHGRKFPKISFVKQEFKLQDAAATIVDPSRSGQSTKLVTHHKCSVSISSYYFYYFGHTFENPSLSDDLLDNRTPAPAH